MADAALERELASLPKDDVRAQPRRGAARETARESAGSCLGLLRTAG
jgi:hypothetical protein